MQYKNPSEDSDKYDWLLRDAPTDRTQISLQPELKEILIKASTARGESLSEYLRKAAVKRLNYQAKSQEERKKAIENFAGSSSWDPDHPNWSSPEAVENWLRGIRDEWGK